MPHIKINGVEHTIHADPQMPLLWTIRDIAGLTGPNSTVASAPAGLAQSGQGRQAGAYRLAVEMCNAIYAATGKRIRTRPVDPQLLKA